MRSHLQVEYRTYFHSIHIYSVWESKEQSWYASLYFPINSPPVWAKGLVDAKILNGFLFVISPEIILCSKFICQYFQHKDSKKINLNQHQLSLFILESTVWGANVLPVFLKALTHWRLFGFAITHISHRPRVYWASLQQVNTQIKKVTKHDNPIFI